MSFSRRTFLQATTGGTLAVAMAKPARAERQQRPTPAWYDEAKFGIFVHWNAAAIPAYAPVGSAELDDALEPDTPLWRQQQQWRLLPYAEMYQNTMLVPGSETARYHREKYGTAPYAEFVAQFREHTLEAWNPRPWAELFARAGAKYVVFTTKTEDGFLFWPSNHPNPHQQRWQARGDAIGELANAVGRKGMRFGAYYSSGLDWTFANLPITDNESFGAALFATDLDYAEQHWRDLIERYQPSVLWSDYGFLPWPGATGMIEQYTTAVPDGVVNDRFGGEAPVDFTTVEYSTEYPEPGAKKWEACRGIGTSFGFNQLEDDASYLSGTELIHLLVDIVAQGGNLLLNVGPTGTGQIPREQERRLRDIGTWLASNGAAIYGTTPWQRAKGVTTERRDVRYTRTTEAVYAIVLGNPENHVVDIDVSLPDGGTVTLLGNDGPLRWERSPHGTRITLPRRRAEQAALSLRLTPATGVTVPPPRN